VGYEVASRGLGFWGCDINPVANLIARVKHAPIDAGAFAARAERIIDRFASASDAPMIAGSAVDELGRWYSERQLSDMMKLRNAIRSEVEGQASEVDAFDCAFSAMAKATSQWRSRSTKPALDPEKRPTAVVKAFHHRCRFMANAWSSGAAPSGTDVRIVRGCATEADAAGRPVDLIVTSPPYATSYEYADLHQLSALWLGLVAARRDLRTGVIGTACRRVGMSRALRELNPVGIRIAFGLYERDRAAAESVAAYLLDMQRVASRSLDMLRPGGMAVFVIGDATLRGVRIANSEHLVESLLEAGFGRVEVVRRDIVNKANTPFRTATGRLSAVPAASTIYAQEHVIMARRP
jgi:hypothetical protein